WMRKPAAVSLISMPRSAYSCSSVASAARISSVPGRPLSSNNCASSAACSDLPAASSAASMTLRTYDSFMSGGLIGRLRQGARVSVIRVGLIGVGLIGVDRIGVDRIGVDRIGVDRIGMGFINDAVGLAGGADRLARRGG